MAKRIQVGGRIESKEVGGIVTGAAEILDDAKGKKQSVINQETDDELLRLDQSKQDNLTFDNAPTEGSDNPVKSGGLYTAQQAILLAIAAINELIPSAASTLNQLADKAFVNSSISTNTATFRGTSAAGLNEQQFLAWANGLTHDLNDYVFWQTSDAAGNTLFKRYKWNGTEWAYEYTLNNSTFTAEQWEAIQSGITALLVTKLRALPTAQELIQSFDSKQDVLTFDDLPTLGSTNPVKSSGIYNVIKAITDLIPAEATAQNQLADKADVAAKIVAAIPSWKGQYDALTDLQAVTGAKAGDMGCVNTTDSDGHAVLTFYQYSAQGAWMVYYTLRHYAQNKPATTGTTGDYPFNGMGRIRLKKNIVNGVNTLTQAMLTQQNTIYVIQYDFTLASDVTIPANCVLEFDGGSISGNKTLTGTNTGINAGLVKIFNTDVTLEGTWDVPDAYPEWFGAKGDGQSPITHQHSGTDNTIPIQKCLNSFQRTILCGRCYYVNSYTDTNNKICLIVPLGHTLEGKNVQHDQYFSYNIIVGNDIKDGNIIRLEKNTTLRNLYIEGAIYQQDTEYGTAVSTAPETWTSRLTLENVNTQAFDIHFNLITYISDLIRCTASGGRVGFWIHSWSNGGRGTTLNMTSCYAHSINTQPYRIENMAYSKITTCAADHCATVENSYVYAILYCADISMENCGTEDSGAACITAGTYLVKINGLRIYYNNDISFLYMFLFRNPVEVENVVLNKRFSDKADSYSKVFMASSGGRVIAKNNIIHDRDVVSNDLQTYDTGKFIEIDSYNWPKKGDTRPTIPSFVTYEFFDTTLGKPIYWTGSAWVDATGQTV